MCSKGAEQLAIEGDGELFAVRRSADGRWAYDWFSGRNEGNGFGSSGPPNPSPEEHRKYIRNFLDVIDPATG